jgi:hypothetical protein
MDVLCTVSFQRVVCSNHVTVQINRHGERKTRKEEEEEEEEEEEGRERERECEAGKKIAIRKLDVK